MPVHPKINTAILRHQVDLLRLEAGTRRRVIKLLDNMVSDLTGMLSAHDLTKFSKARVNALMSQATDTVEGYYAKANTLTQKTLTGVAEAQAAHTTSLLDKTFAAVVDFSASLPTDTYLERIASNALIIGAPSEEWWARQSRDAAFRFSTAVRQGLVAGDTTETIAARIAGRQGYPGILDIVRANARSLVHTSIMEVANESRMETFKQNDDVVEGIRQVSTLDSNTTDICMAYDGAEWDLSGEPMPGTSLPYEGGVPRHWGCRSVEVPITMTFKELGINLPEPTEGTRASADGPVPASTTFADFLAEHTAAEQDEMLGAGRAEMWRNGDITLQQLLDQKGNPLTLEELQQKYG